jgi:molybdenum cofactor guanylyltransferase
MNDNANDTAERPLGVILAGGLARRMGGGDKGLVALGGRSMLARVIAALAPQCAGLVLNANGDPARFAGFGLPVVPDTVAGFAGPLAGVLAGMEWALSARPVVDDILTFPADTPFPPADLVARLQQARREAGATIAVAASGWRRHHVVALWPVALAPALRRALVEEGLRKVESFADRFAVAVAEWPAEPDDPFFNVNTSDDLAAAEARLSGGRGAPRRDGLPPG